ncbi:MAG: 4-vinyl reductase [Nanoarchaeota archaeon]
MLSALIKKLLFVRQFSIDEGKVEILGERHVMLPDSALLELQEIDPTKFYELMKSSALKQLQDFVDHARVYKNLKDVLFGDIGKLSRKLGTGEGIVKNLQDIFSIYGLEALEIPSLDNAKKEAVVRVRDSTIARAYLNKNKARSRKPTCVITAAVLAAMFSFLFGKNVDAAEDKCMSQNSTYCEFTVR